MIEAIDILPTGEKIECDGPWYFFAFETVKGNGKGIGHATVQLWQPIVASNANEVIKQIEEHLCARAQAQKVIIINFQELSS